MLATAKIGKYFVLAVFFWRKPYNQQQQKAPMPHPTLHKEGADFAENEPQQSTIAPYPTASERALERATQHYHSIN
ncbi:MAG: hypothetical protein HUK17_04285 [Bacteroidales bacterium]|nr:hypothetical protein [Bacteroidales bacterium]